MPGRFPRSRTRKAGTLVIGIETGRDAEKAMAVAISDGVDSNLWEPKLLQRIVAANISPSLNGLVVRPIPLSGTNAGRVAFIIEVPKGETAHQSPMDFRYYGRHELEAKPLTDNIVRLLMNRDRAAHAVIELSSIALLTAEAELSRRQAQLARSIEAENEDEFIPPARRRARDEERERLAAPKRGFDECTFELSIRNDGPITIRDCSLALLARAELGVEFIPKPEGERWMFHFLPTSIVRQTSSQWGTSKETVPVRERKLFPEQVMPFP